MTANPRLATFTAAATLCLVALIPGGSVLAASGGTKDDAPAVREDVPEAIDEVDASDTNGSGARITDLVTPPPGEKPADGLPPNLARGVLGVYRADDDAFVVVFGSDTTKAERGNVIGGLSASDGAEVRWEVANASAAEMIVAWRELSKGRWLEGSRVPYVMDLDPRSGTIVIELAGPETMEILTTAARAEAVSPGNITALATGGGASRLVSRFSDSSPHWGGANIDPHVSGYCTAGFSVTLNSSGNDKSVTAGHCGPNGRSFDSGSYFYGELAGKSNFPDYDQARLVGSSYNNKIWTDGLDAYSTRAVLNANDGAIGDLICASGSTTLSICSIEINSFTAKYCDEAGCTTYLMRGTKNGNPPIVRPGDSGGPVYHRNTSASKASIRGIIIAGDTVPGTSPPPNTYNRIYAERYDSISGHLGVTILTSPYPS